MERKQFLQGMAYLGGGIALLSPTLLLQGCTYEPRKRTDLSTVDIPFLDEIGETILPTTQESPGAKSAAIGQYMVTMVNDCLEMEEQRIFLEGLNHLDAHCAAQYKKSFIDLDSETRLKIIRGLQEEAMEYAIKNEGSEKLVPPHYFDLFKGLTISGYFSSEIGMTIAREYIPVPGKYIGCVSIGANRKPLS